MKLVATLMDTAQADTELLRTLDGQGDDFSVPRDVDFLLRAPSQERAELVASFINDYQYGRASAHSEEASHTVSVLIAMPVEQHAILSVSGFMACLCHLYDLEYDGWGCQPQVRT